MISLLNQLKKDLKKIANPKKAKDCLWFFKTGKGQYGEGDKFLGVSVPEQRKVAKKYPDLDLSDLQKLLSSQIHEYRLTALFILVGQYKKIKQDRNKKTIVDFYIKNAKRINNWDLVDSSAHYIIGDYLLDKKDRKILYKLAKSKNLWEKRISIISCFAFIRDNQYEDALKISEILLHDEHDLIHKAVGWMLREVGNRDQETEEKFLKKYHKTMPRTMLRYAVEKFKENKRQSYLSGVCFK
ncbi:MAG: DNA alkylation repair protein [bacterium]